MPSSAKPVILIVAMGDDAVDLVSSNLEELAALAELYDEVNEIDFFVGVPQRDNVRVFGHVSRDNCAS